MMFPMKGFNHGDYPTASLSLMDLLYRMDFGKNSESE